MMTPAEQKLIPWLRTCGPSVQDIPDGEVGWIELAGAAAATGLAGLLLERVQDLGIEAPAPARQKLHIASMGVAANSVHMAGELSDILVAFQNAGLPVMLLKGAALNQTIYESLALRPMSDLDLMVRPDDLPTALNVLSAAGCRMGQALLRDDFFPKYHYETELITNSARPARIDLHVRPFRPLRYARTVPEDALWENRGVVQWNETGASIPCPESILIHLAVHAAVHGFSRLIWLYDLRRMADHYGSILDWSLVIRRANRWRLTWPLYCAVARAGELLGSVAPGDVLEELAAIRPNWCDRLTLWQAPRDAGKPMDHVLVNLMTTPGLLFRIGYVRALLFPGRKHLEQLYSPRHPAWPLFAQIWRVLRGVARLTAVARDVMFRGIARCLPPLHHERIGAELRR